MDLSLLLPAFIAGLLTFLAPCTLPLVPGFLGFISGVSIKDFEKKESRVGARRKIFINGFLYVVGFTIVFVLLGSIFGLAGSTLVKYRFWLVKIGSIFIIFFGLYLMRVFDFKFFAFLSHDKRLNFSRIFIPGKPLSSLLFGMVFAFGWTPCVGPVLGSILFLATTSGTVLQGAFMLFIFSLGLAIPFLMIALGFGHATEYIKKIAKYLGIISKVGGFLLVLLGILLLTDNVGIWIGYFYEVFSFINYEGLLDYL